MSNPLIVNFSNPLGEQINPSNSSYQLYAYEGTANLLWSTQTINTALTNQFYVANTTVLNITDDSTVYLPDVTLASTGSTFTISNPSPYILIVLASDSNSVCTIQSGQQFVFNTSSSVVVTNQSACWAFYVLGATTNTNTLSQNLGPSLTYVATSNNVQVQQQVTQIQNALPLSGNAYTLDIDQAIEFSATTLINLPDIDTQINVLLGVSSVLYSTCGFTCTFVNEGSQPIVLQTQGDTINGLPLQSLSNSASFVLRPSSSCIVTSTNNGDWLVTSISTPFQNIFRTTSINLATANWVGLSLQSTSSQGVSDATIVPAELGAATIAIDMSNNLDLIYSPIWIFQGTPPPDIIALMESLNQSTFWIILPNNFTSIYFILAQANSTFKFGLACKYSYNGNTLVAMVNLNHSYPVSGHTSWVFQYNAHITSTTTALTEYFASLLLGSGGSGGGDFPDIVDQDGTVTITGPGGLVINPGPLRLNAQGGTINGVKIATVVHAPAVINHLVVVGAGGQPIDGGVQVSTNELLLPGTDALVPTQRAVRTYIEEVLTSPIIIKGSWLATYPTPIGGNPDLMNGVGTLGWTYICAGPNVSNNSADFGAGLITDINEGDYIFYNQDNEWVIIRQGNIVESVNGFIGVVNLGLKDLDNVVIPSPGVNDILTYNGTQWIAGQFPVMTLEELDDVSVVNQQNNQSLVWNSASSKWINATIPTGTDFDATRSIGTPYTILQSDVNTLLYPPDTPCVVNFPNATGFAVGDLFCIYSKVGTINLTHALDVVTSITMSNASSYYRIITDRSSWYITEISIAPNFTANQPITLTQLTNGSLNVSFHTLGTTGIATLNSLIVTNTMQVNGATASTFAVAPTITSLAGRHSNSVAVLSDIPTSSASGGKQVFRTSSTFTVPSGVTTIYITGSGAGGGGAGSNNPGTAAAGGPTNITIPGYGTIVLTGGNGASNWGGGGGGAPTQSYMIAGNSGQGVIERGSYGGGNGGGNVAGAVGASGSGGGRNESPQNPGFFGGGGAGGCSNNNNGAGGGGGAGACLYVQPYTVVPGNVITIAIGTGGSNSGGNATGGGNGFVLIEW